VKLRALETAALAFIRPNNRAGERAAAAVSTSVRSGAGWIACSAVLAATGGRGRNAAVDGLAAWGLAEVAAAGVKRVAERRRPRLAGTIGAAPRSSSMPSAHTAAAVAYAVAAGAAAPAVALPAGALALAVAWSRMSTGNHFPTDVAAAVALGAATGATVAVIRRKAHDDAPVPA
jgi:undecaprenyl-diphosphatase